MWRACRDCSARNITGPAIIGPAAAQGVGPRPIRHHAHGPQEEAAQGLPAVPQPNRKYAFSLLQRSATSSTTLTALTARTTHRTRGSLGPDGGVGDPLYWVMEPSELSLGKRLGGGNFGEVGGSPAKMALTYVEFALLLTVDKH